MDCIPVLQALSLHMRFVLLLRFPLVCVFGGLGVRHVVLVWYPSFFLPPLRSWLEIFLDRPTLSSEITLPRVVLSIPREEHQRRIWTRPHDVLPRLIGVVPRMEPTSIGRNARVLSAWILGTVQDGLCGGKGERISIARRGTSHPRARGSGSPPPHSRSTSPRDLRSSSAHPAHLPPGIASGLSPVRFPFHRKPVPVVPPFRPGFEPVLSDCNW